MSGFEALTLKQLRALAAVARRGSIVAAAQELNLTAPAVHSQIKALEGVLAVPVLQRSSDTAGSQLTEYGQVLLEAAARIEVILSQAAGQVDALSRGHAGKVTLAVVSTAKYFAPKLVKRLKGLFPEIEVVLRVGNRGEVIRDLETQAADLAVMGRPPRWPPLDMSVIGPHPHGLVVAPDHPLADRAEVAAGDLWAETFLAREPGSGTRILMTRYLDRIGDGQVFETVEMGSNETIKQAVIAGLGIAFLSLHTVMDELHGGRLKLLPAPGLPIQRHWYLVWPTAQAMRPATERVQRAILDLKGNFLPD